MDLLGITMGFLLAIIILVAKYKVFKKANQPGWGVFIPIYHDYLLFKIAGHAKWVWWILLPPIFIILKIVTAFIIAKKFGKSAWLGLGLLYVPMIFYPILAWGPNKYDEKKKMVRTPLWEGLAIFAGIIAILISSFLWILYHPGKRKPLDKLRLNIQTPFMKALSDYLIDGEASNWFGLIDEHEFYRNDDDMISREEFSTYMPQLERGDVIFTDGARYISSIVIPGTRKHALIYLGSGEIIDATSKGVTTGMISDLDNLSRGSLLKSIIAFRPNLAEAQKEQFIGFAFDQLGKPYDFDYNKEDKEAYYCSELVADGLSAVGIDVSYESKSIGKMVVSPEDMVNYIGEVGIEKGEFENVFYLEKDDNGALVDKNTQEIL